MARAITMIPEALQPETLRNEAWNGGTGAPADLFVGHEESLSEALRLIDLLHQTGVLQAAGATLEHGTDLIDILVREVDRPGAVGGIKNVIAIVQGMMAMDAKGLSRLLHGVAEGTKLAASGQQVNVNGVFDIMKQIQDKDISAGLAWIFTLLKGIGQRVQTDTDEKA